MTLTRNYGQNSLKRSKILNPVKVPTLIIKNAYVSKIRIKEMIQVNLSNIKMLKKEAKEKGSTQRHKQHPRIKVAPTDKSSIQGQKWHPTTEAAPRDKSSTQGQQ